MPDVSTATVRNEILALSYLQNETSQKSQTFRVCRLSYVVYNAAEILVPGVKLRAGRQECRHCSPHKCMMRLSYYFEIVPKYLVPKHNIRPEYRPHKPHSNGDIGPRKPRKSVFRQNGTENYFRFQFSLHIPILRGRLGR